MSKMKVTFMEGWADQLSCDLTEEELLEVEKQLRAKFESFTDEDFENNSQVLTEEEFNTILKGNTRH